MNETDMPAHGDGCGCAPTVKFQPVDLLVVGTNLLFGIAKSFAAAAYMLDDIAVSHANWRHERASFTTDVLDTLDGLS